MTFREQLVDHLSAKVGSEPEETLGIAFVYGEGDGPVTPLVLVMNLIAAAHPWRSSHTFIKDEAAPEITSIGWMDHAGRKFIKALRAVSEGKKYASISHAVLVLLRELYAIEREIRGCEPGQRYAVRQIESKYFLKRIKRLIAEASD